MFRNAFFLSLAVLFALCLLLPCTSRAEDARYIIDGGPTYPKEWTASRYEDENDVVPEQVDAIDIRSVAVDRRDFRVSEQPEIEEGFVFLIGFKSAGTTPFSGPEERSLEIFFDTRLGAGDPTTEWALSLGEEGWDPFFGFAPDQRIRVTWKEGKIVEKAFETWTGSTWEGHSGMDTPEMEVAIAERWMEGAVRWEYIRPQPFTKEGQEYEPLGYTIRTTQGESHDYFPDLGAEWLGGKDIVWQVVRESLWGRIKHKMDHPKAQ